MTARRSNAIATAAVVMAAACVLCGSCLYAALGGLR